MAVADFKARYVSACESASLAPVAPLLAALDDALEGG